MGIQFRTRSQSFIVDPDTLPGACCASDGTCSDTGMSLTRCHLQDGKFTPNRTCDQVDCDAGVCCVSGICYELTEEACVARDGFFAGKQFDCYSYDCCAGSTAETQACCFEGQSEQLTDPAATPFCNDLRPCECLNKGGVPRGPGSNCTAINAAGGCGVTGQNSLGCCCVDGVCKGADPDNLFGYTASVCASMGGYWGGSGSTCGDGSDFDKSWPCSWPTGACCGKFTSPEGITYCADGKTYGGCLDSPPGGSGGLAWKLGATCATTSTLESRDGASVNCMPRGAGMCCIPHGISMEVTNQDEPYEFTYNYTCYRTEEDECYGTGIGIWHEEDPYDPDTPVSCDSHDCCELMINHPDYLDEIYQCSNGGDGVCCQFDSSSGEYLGCLDADAFLCNSLDIDLTNNIDTVFTVSYSDNPVSCVNDQGGGGNSQGGNDGTDPCTGIPIPGRSCCLFNKTDGEFFRCLDLTQDVTMCPPREYENYFGEVRDLPCSFGTCGEETIGACCRSMGSSESSGCISVPRSACQGPGSDFYPGLNCNSDCDQIPCCNPNIPQEISSACGSIDNTSVCLDKSAYPFRDMTADDYRDEFQDNLGNDYPVESIVFFTDSAYNCESCDFTCSRNRGNCCWNGICIPHVTQSECFSYGSDIGSCVGMPFTNIEEAMSMTIPCLSSSCDDFVPVNRRPSVPLNFTAYAAKSSKDVRYLRNMNNAQFINHTKIDIHGFRLPAYYNDWTLPNIAEKRSQYPDVDRYHNLQGSYMPRHVFLSWKDAPDYRAKSGRNYTGVPCENYNMAGCAPLSVRGTCCVKEPCGEDNIPGWSPGARNQGTTADPRFCYECIENLTECDCANRSGATECQRSNTTLKYDWIAGDVSCSQCPCNDPDLESYQINDCSDNVINKLVLDD